jgi:hypothetical protein
VVIDIVEVISVYLALLILSFKERHGSYTKICIYLALITNDTGKMKLDGDHIFYATS